MELGRCYKLKVDIGADTSTAGEQGSLAGRCSEKRRVVIPSCRLHGRGVARRRCVGVLQLLAVEKRRIARATLM